VPSSVEVALHLAKLDVPSPSLACLVFTRGGHLFTAAHHFITFLSIIEQFLTFHELLGCLYKSFLQNSQRELSFYYLSPI
jgi:hypothetical protein